MVNYEGLNTSIKTEENSEMADNDKKRDIIHMICKIPEQ